jgi:hypothetical protein
MRLIANGGRAAEKNEVGPDGFGAITVGTRTLSETGAVGKWRRESVEVFCVANLINCALEADDENVVIDLHFSVVDGGMQARLETACRVGGRIGKGCRGGVMAGAGRSRPGPGRPAWSLQHIP